MNIIITAPSLDSNVNVSGVSSVTKFIIENNAIHKYTHVKLGKPDNDKTVLFVIFRTLSAWIKWGFLILFKRHLFVHFNFALDKKSIIRDAPLILFTQLIHKKMVIHLHGGEFLQKEKVPSWIKKILNLIFSGKEPIIVLSSLEKELIIEKYHAKNVVVLPNCIDIKDAKKFDRVYLGQPPIVILFLGRIVLRKGIEYILQALALLKNKKLSFKFILAGTGPEEEIYIRKYSEILGNAFEFKGVISGNEKSELIKKSDIFLLPSTSGEGLPISLLECMSYGMVPIVTDDGSMKHVVKHGQNGFIVNKKSSIEIADAIESLYNNLGLMQKLGRNASRLIFESFDPSVYIENLNKIYNYA